MGLNNSSEYAWLHHVRDFEIDYSIEILKNYLKNSNRDITNVLEIGSGDGYVIDRLSKLFPDIRFNGVDVEGSAYTNQSSLVKKYNGKDLDFPLNHFDIIFSIHTLEHIKDLSIHFRSVADHLKSDGYYACVVPSSIWRLLTTINFYPSFIVHFNELKNKFLKRTKSHNINRKSTKKKSIIYYLFPRRHGESGNVFTEFFLFSLRSWSTLLKKLTREHSMALIYASYIPYVYCSKDPFRKLLNNRIRMFLSKILTGSSIILISQNKSIHF